MAEEHNDNNETFTGLVKPDELAPELQAIYKSMQADYTRKTQEIASRRKEFEQKETQFQEQLKDYGALQQRVNEWENWYKTIENAADDIGDQANDYNLGEPNTMDYLNEQTPEIAKIVKGLQSQVQSLSGELESTKQALRDSGSQVNRMFGYQAQLSDLLSRHKDLDKHKLLEHAMKTGTTDLEKAYEDLYRDEIINDIVEERLKEKMAEMRTSGIRSAQKVVVRAGDSTPRNFEDATEQILRQRATEGLLE